jgi:iron complex transport system permease protein
VLAGLWVLLVVASLGVGPADLHDPVELSRGALGALGLGAGLSDPSLQLIVELRLWRALTAGAVGGALALAGALLQGLFRNGLASPAVLGVTAGATLGATAAIALLGGLGAVALSGLVGSPALVTAAGFVGAVLVAALVFTLATSRGRVSVPTLLLAGIAANTILAGLIAAIQSIALSDFELSRAIFAWSFGTLDDRLLGHVLLAGGGMLAAAAVIPFVATELDLLAGGEDDARALGVPVGRVQVLAIGAAALATATAVSVAGQIAFVGLVVPHLLRMLVGTGHRWLLPLSVLLGAVFLLGCDTAQRALLGDHALRPGVVMSLIGGPFFLGLLARNRRAMEAW